MKRMATWVFDVTETAAYDIASSMGLRVMISPNPDQAPWAVVLFSTHELKDSYLCVVDWAESPDDGKRKLRAAVEDLSSPAVNTERVADQIVGAIQYLTAQGLQTDERIQHLIDEIRRRFGLGGDPS